jgi:FtsP/CotA-like multicopper oxidase with cupredoxin domain
MNVSPRADSAGANTFGTKWLKALYRGYTNESFSQYSEQPPWQGTQGPTLRGEVGDMIEIMFINKMTNNYATMHSMGLDYTKYSEGADYPNSTTPGTSNQLPQTDAVSPIQAGIAPSGCVAYKWLVSDSAGPNADEPSRTHSYHSYVSLAQDSNAGLIGPTIVYASGQMAKTMAEYREIPLLYMIYKEPESFLSASNVATLQRSTQSTNAALGSTQSTNAALCDDGMGSDYGGTSNARPARSTDSTTYPSGNYSAESTDSTAYLSGNYSIWHPQLVNLASSGQFPTAPLFYTMNGYIFANNPTFQMCLNDKVIWYVNAYGAASHVFHMHGNGFKYHGFSEYAISINDGVGKTLVMDAVGEGLWQVICHVDNHHALGMVSNYRVYNAGQCKLNKPNQKAAEGNTYP